MEPKEGTMSTFEEEVKFAVLSVIRGFRQGTAYGTKIRLPHALVMGLIFSYDFTQEGTRKLLDRVAKLTWEHSRNLALFAGFYKMALALARLVRVRLGDKLQAPPGKPTTQLDSFLAAALVGHFVWGRYSSVNYQIVVRFRFHTRAARLVPRVATCLRFDSDQPPPYQQQQQQQLYLLSRIIVASTIVASNNGVPFMKDIDFQTAYPYLASIVWGIVLWLFEFHHDALQASLASSMDFLYHDSNSWAAGTSDFFPTPATSAILVYMILRARNMIFSS